MKFTTAFAAVSLLFTSALEALTIVTPTAGTTVAPGGQISLLVQNGVGETAVNAAITIASPCGSATQVVPIGLTEIFNLPCQINGQTVISAQAAGTVTASVQISVGYSYVNPAIVNPCFNPCGNPCVNPCPTPCVNPCVKPCYRPMPCPPRHRHSRHSHHARRGCGYYNDENSEMTITEFNPETIGQQIAAQAVNAEVAESN